jgi:hypothetical protein
MRELVRGCLQGEEIVRAEITLVIRISFAFENRFAEIRHALPL